MFYIFFLFCSLDMSRTLLSPQRRLRLSLAFRVNLLLFLLKCLSFLKDFSEYRLTDKTVFFLQHLKVMCDFLGASTASRSSVTEMVWTAFPSRVVLISHWLNFFLKDSISCSLGRPQTDYIAKEDDSDPLVLLHLPPGSWDHRYEPPLQVYAALGSKPQALSMPGEHPNSWAACLYSGLGLRCWKSDCCICISGHMLRCFQKSRGEMRLNAGPRLNQGAGGVDTLRPATPSFCCHSYSWPLYCMSRDWWTTHKPSPLALIWSGISVAAVRGVTNSSAPTWISLASSYLGFI